MIIKFYLCRYNSLVAVHEVSRVMSYPQYLT